MRICAPLAIEDHIPQPALFVSPPKWHLGHTTWFFETFIARKRKDYKPFRDSFAYCFNSYYESLGDRVKREERGHQSRPLLQEVLDYRAYVDEYISEALSSDNEWDENLISLFEVGLNHEQQHQELLWYDLKFILGSQALEPIYSLNAKDGISQRSPAKWLRKEEGLVDIGFNGKGFSFDNEGPAHQVFVPAFEIRQDLVTNAEWLSFIEDKGYDNPLLWTSDGWAWRKEKHITAPLYWQKEPSGEWSRFTLRGRENVDPEQAVQHISWYEAAAFCEWGDYRLPTEFEWESAAKDLNWGSLWEHTSSAYLPYPNFKAEKGAVGEYNGKFMINQMVLRGASHKTSKDHSRPTYRNFFHPEMRWHFSGLRPVRRT